MKLAQRPLQTPQPSQCAPSPLLLPPHLPRRRRQHGVVLLWRVAVLAGDGVHHHTPVHEHRRVRGGEPQAGHGAKVLAARHERGGAVCAVRVEQHLRWGHAPLFCAHAACCGCSSGANSSTSPAGAGPWLRQRRRTWLLSPAATCSGPTAQNAGSSPTPSRAGSPGAPGRQSMTASSLSEVRCARRPPADAANTAGSAARYDSSCPPAVATVSTWPSLLHPRPATTCPGGSSTASPGSSFTLAPASKTCRAFERRCVPPARKALQRPQGLQRTCTHAGAAGIQSVRAHTP